MNWLKCFLPCLSFAEESMKLAVKEQQNVDNTLERVKDEQHPVGKAVEAKAMGKDLSEAQQKKAHDLFHEFGYNVHLSDQLPLNHSIPDAHHSRCLQKTYPSQLPSLNVILIFMNEALSSVQRAIVSIISWTPSRLLKEIILMDDFSSNAEPILAQIQEDHSVIVSPVFDDIHFDTFELTKYELAVDGFNWELWCHYDLLPKAWVDLNDVTAPLKSPSIIGILTANRFFLGKTGSVDGGLVVYGGESVELSLRVWQCGGKTEVLPCSRIAHLERHHRPYALDLISALKHNAVRVAKIWMDE
ncbi:hypothetical protein HJG60_010188 [Phyllostomus discolor]|uniref:Uncharacterized protein n=1 Tax=Phyllostomus discolor TaxID=89673 RepID=A0A834ASJ6_9CHIR|nr:hypothetical protein HJG60_010188 [Phyllostomus discolor]